MLLALTSAKRQSDLHAIDLAFMKSLPEGVEFKIPGLTKTRIPGKDIVFLVPIVAIKHIIYSIHDLFIYGSKVQWPST
jgi:hypothetical protein